MEEMDKSLTSTIIRMSPWWQAVVLVKKRLHPPPLQMIVGLK